MVTVKDPPHVVRGRRLRASTGQRRHQQDDAADLT
jgi:hypothetical protein